MRSAERDQAVRKALSELLHAARRTSRRSRDRLHGRESVLDPVVQFPDEEALMLLQARAFGHVSKDRRHPEDAAALLRHASGRNRHIHQAPVLPAADALDVHLSFPDRAIEKAGLVLEW